MPKSTTTPTEHGVGLYTSTSNKEYYMSKQTTGTVKYVGKRDKAAAMNTHSQRARRHGWSTYTPARIKKQGIRVRGSHSEAVADEINWRNDGLLIDTKYGVITVY